MGAWESIGSMYYPVYGSHDIIVRSSSSGLTFRAVFPLVLNNKLVPGGVAVHANVPFTFPCSTYPEIEPLWSYFYDPNDPLFDKTTLGPGNAIWPVRADFLQPTKYLDAPAYGWWQVARTAIPATLVRPGACPWWSWMEFTNFSYVNAYYSYFNEKYTYQESILPNYSTKWFVSNISVAQQGQLSLDSWASQGHDTYYLALKNPDLGPVLPDGSNVKWAPPISEKDYMVVATRVYPLSLAGKKWSPGLDPLSLGLPQIGSWGSNFATPGKLMPWSQCGGRPRAPYQIRLKGGAQGYTGKDPKGAVDFVVTDVTSQYVAPNLGGKAFPYPLVDMNTGIPIPQIDNSLLYKSFAVRVSSDPQPPQSLIVRGPPDLDVLTKKFGPEYHQKKVTVLPYRATVARIDLEGWFP